MEQAFQYDVDVISRIESIPTILDVVCRTTGMGFSAVARVTEDRWIACSVLDTIDFGLKPGGELKVKTTICNEIRASHEAVVIDHVAEDEAFCGHHTPAMYGFQSYISMPIMLKDGSFFGTLCAIDPKPAKLKNPETIGMFKLFAELIASHIDATIRLDAAEAAAQEQRSLKELREQFIAVLGHDLRNPLMSITSGLSLLERTDDAAKRALLMGHMRGSAIRIGGLIDNVLDFARTRLGDKLSLAPAEPAALEPILAQVIEEFRIVDPTRKIETDFDLAVPVSGDHLRLARMFSNLLGNALLHGAAGEPVKISAKTADGLFRFRVENSGKPIPERVMANLFQPFIRDTSAQTKGLGLGLYISSAIAKMHGGTLRAESSPDSTVFEFTMPIDR